MRDLWGKQTDLHEVMGMHTRDIMSHPVHTVRTDDSIEHAAALLTQKKITAVPVLDDAGKLVGMVSEGDLLRDRVPADVASHPWRGADEDIGSRPKSVAEVMSSQVLTSIPAEDVADVAQTMLNYSVRSMPVLDDGRLVGIISRRDIVRSVIHTDDMLTNEVQHRLDEYAGDLHRWNATVSDGVATIDGAADDEAERTIVTVIARTVPGIAAVHLTAPPPLTAGRSPDSAS